MDMVGDPGVFQQEFPGIWNAGSLDCCWDPSGISHHIIELVGDGSSCTMDLMFRRTHMF